MNHYHRDPSAPFWRANIDIDSLFANHAHRPERAQAWLRFWNVSQQAIFEQAVLIRGNFECGILANHTYHWTFTPTFAGNPAIVLPVYEQGRLIDFLAISRDDHTVWGCCTGAGQFVGQFVSPTNDPASPVALTVHETPVSWLTCGHGILPLAKSFFPLLQFAHSIIAQDASHAWKIAHQAFIYPAERLGLDCDAAEQAAFDRISFEEEAA